MHCGIQAQSQPLRGHLGPSLCRKRTQTPLYDGSAHYICTGILKPHAPRSDIRCKTLEQEGALEISQALNGNGKTRTGKDATEAFQQLRQAVLSSLDFSDSIDQAPDWDSDSAYDSSIEDVNIEHPTAAAVGKAVYETLRIDPSGKTRRIYTRRRDLIRTYKLQPRDLRRVDPSLGLTKTSPSITIKDSCLLVNIGGVRGVIAADKMLVFEPNSPSSRKFLESVTPRLQDSFARRGRGRAAPLVETNSYAAEASSSFSDMEERVFPFELEMLEGAFMVATGKLEGELVNATRRVSSMLQKLPKEITPVNLEELRRIKQLLVELESKAENLRDMIEEIMDDEDEVRDLNLSSRPIREEKRRQREIDRLEREAERRGEARAMEILSSVNVNTNEATKTIDLPGISNLNTDTTTSNGGINSGATTDTPTTNSNSISEQQQALSARARLGSSYSIRESAEYGDGSSAMTVKLSENGNEEAMDAWEELLEEEEEERELEEVEDLLEYYLQRAATTQSEAERLLAGARDLEESIGVSLSARRFEVNRLELLLSIASFAAALGAMVASIFGMNLRSTLEMSVIGFWGTTVGIVFGSAWVFWMVFKYTKRKRIL